MPLRGVAGFVIKRHGLGGRAAIATLDNGHRSGEAGVGGFKSHSAVRRRTRLHLLQIGFDLLYSLLEIRMAFANFRFQFRQLLLCRLDLGQRMTGAKGLRENLL